eukprot:755642-Hanusia_phi.AAC.3
MQTAQVEMEESDAAGVAEAERRYLLSLLTMAEELLALLPETVKKKYGIIKGTLAVRLGSKISNLPKTSVIFTSLSQGIQPHLPSKEHSSITTPRDSKQLDQDQVDRKLTAWNQSNETEHKEIAPRSEMTHETMPQVFREASHGRDVSAQLGCESSERNALASSLLKRHFKSLASMCKRIQQSRSSEPLVNKSETLEIEFQNVAEGIASCCEEFARLEVLVEQELHLGQLRYTIPSRPVFARDTWKSRNALACRSNLNAGNYLVEFRQGKSYSQNVGGMKRMDVDEVIRQRDEARMEVNRLEQELSKSNALLENAILRALVGLPFS